MRSVATVTSKGQITVPQEVRAHLGLREGDRLEFVIEGGITTVRPLRDENPFEAYAGALGTFEAGVEEINAWVRGLRDDDEPEAPKAPRGRRR
jgi:AbrB family looped-hinge helix DNA binding protein